jgi:hypothetical protein
MKMEIKTAGGLRKDDVVVADEPVSSNVVVMDLGGNMGQNEPIEPHAIRLGGPGQSVRGKLQGTRRGRPVINGGGTDSL